MVLISDIIHQLAQYDQGVFIFFNHLHCEFFDYFMSLFSGKWIWVPMYVAIVYVLFRNYSWKVALTALLMVGLTILLADQICSGLLKPMVERLRPSNLDNPLSAYVHIVDGYRGARYSFPSSHAANTVGLTVFMLLLLKKRWLTFFLSVWAVITCYSRMYLGVHYPGDLLVGTLIGAGCGALMYFLFRKIVIYIIPLKYQNNISARYVYYPIYVGLLIILSIIVYAALFSLFVEK